MDDKLQARLDRIGQQNPANKWLYISHLFYFKSDWGTVGGKIKPRCRYKGAITKTNCLYENNYCL